MKSSISWISITTKLSLFICVACLYSCQPVSKSQKPQLIYTPSEEDLQKLTSPNPSLSLNSDWEKEYKVGIAFARERDYYRAITSFKRALVLMPAHSKSKNEIYYNIGLCYYFGKKYVEAVTNLEKIHPTKAWTLYNDYLSILYDAYLKLGEESKAEELLNEAKQSNPALYQKLNTYTPLTKGDLSKLKQSSDISIASWAKDIETHWKSPRKAQILNAVLPGAGYLYVDQKSTAITAFLVNSLFIAATYRLFDRHHVALGILTGTFEMGWYIGGIYGAGDAARTYNRLAYEQQASHVMKQKHLFPALMINYAF